MAKSIPAFTWERGFREPSSGVPWLTNTQTDTIEQSIDGGGAPQSGDGGDVYGAETYVAPPSKEVVTSQAHNDLGVNVLRTWPTLYDGTNSPHGVPEWWKPSNEVDVLICGAGPSGLEIAISLARQGVSFRIIDKAPGPLIAGRADGVQPRFLELLNTLGLAQEVHEEGPLIERTAIYKDGRKLLFGRSHQSDSRYRGLHIITQGQIERIYIRDLMRHRMLVERSSTLKDFVVDESKDKTHPVHATIRNEKTGKEEDVRAKFLVGSDGAGSMVRKKVGIPFDGMSTNIYWGIMDCVFETDYPHAWVFGSVISTKHGGCVIIPREDGYIRLYTQLDVSQTGPLAKSRQQTDSTFAESGGNVDVHSITPDEVLEQANRIFAPYKLKFAAPLSWFAIWKISERVARSFSSPDMRVHLAGDAAHVHSVMGAFGLNASMMDASNLSWKMGLAAQGKADIRALMGTYSLERRGHACRIIEASGEYLRFVCSADISIANVRHLGAKEAESVELHDQGKDNAKEKEEVVKHNGISLNGDKPQTHNIDPTPRSASSAPAVQTPPSSPDPDQDEARKLNKSKKQQELEADQSKDLAFLGSFFGRNGQFLLGVDAPFDRSILTPAPTTDTRPAVLVKPGVRAPNPRVCFDNSHTGYLYDRMVGAATFHVALFVSGAGGAARSGAKGFAAAAFDEKTGFVAALRSRGIAVDVIVVAKCLPDELESVFPEADAGLKLLREKATCVLFDDRAPDEDAHTQWGVDRARGGVAVVRPDLWVGATAGLDGEGAGVVKKWFDGFVPA